MKFRYLIVDEEGVPTGTNERSLALQAACAGECIAVLDALTGEEFDEAGSHRPIDATDPDDFVDPDEEEEDEDDE